VRVCVGNSDLKKKYEQRVTSQTRKGVVSISSLLNARARARERDLQQKRFGESVKKSARKDADAMEEEKAQSGSFVGRDCE